MDKHFHKALYVFTIILLLAGLTITFWQGPTITGYAISNQNNLLITPYCEGYDLTKLTESSFSACQPYTALFSTYKPREMDLLLFMALAMQESSCNPNINDGGILQVDKVCLQEKKCDTIEKQFEEGAKVLEIEIKNTLKTNVDNQHAYAFTFFGYNRGATTMKNAIDYYKDGEQPFFAMKRACDEVFKGETDRYGRDKCNAAGYGPYYPASVFERFSSACGELGGTVVGDVYSVKYTGALGVLGQYNIKPSFSTTQTVNLSVYDYLQSKAQELINDCSSVDDKDECVEQKISQFTSVNLEWSLDCDEQPEFVELVQNYQECLETTDNDCYCPLPKKNFKVEDFTELIFENGKTSFKMTTKTKPVTQLYVDDGGLCIIEDNNRQIIKEQRLLYQEDTRGQKIFIENQPKYLTQPYLYYYNDTGGSHACFTVSDNFPITQAEPAPLCKLQPKAYKLCVKTNNDVIGFDSNTQKIKEQNLTYKFALRLEQTALPPINNLEVLDKAGSEDKILLVFDEAKSKNIDYYNIYIAEQSFIDYPITNHQVKAPFGVQNITIKATSPNNYQLTQPLTTCTFVKIGEPCRFTEQQILIEPNKLYKINDQLVIALKDFETTKNYYIAITVIDKTGLEIDNTKTDQLLEYNKNYAQITSIDDLGPGPVSFKLAGLTTNEITLDWDKPANLDGSTIDDLEKYLVFSQAINTDQNCNIDELLQETPQEKIALAISTRLTRTAGQKQCITIMAKDKQDNPSNEQVKNFLQVYSLE
ncbi:hypothetical protein GOV04_02400 [Candidatus Woesearchaeota archaeon]|nr:hypothetical protein [Candidatus Woesearchaeota archaeon]